MSNFYDHLVDYTWPRINIIMRHVISLYIKFEINKHGTIYNIV